MKRYKMAFLWVAALAAVVAAGTAAVSHCFGNGSTVTAYPDGN